MSPPPSVGSYAASSEGDTSDFSNEKSLSPNGSKLPVNVESQNGGGKTTGCWYNFRRSKILVILIVFIAMMLDLMLITSVEPILPPLVYSVMQPNATERFLANAFLFQRPDDDKRIEMIATTRKHHEHHATNLHHSMNNFTNSTHHLTKHLNCHIFMSLLSNASVTFVQLANHSVYLNISKTMVDCANVSALHKVLFMETGDNSTDDGGDSTDPYLVYALEMSTLFSLKPAAEIFSNIVSGLIVNRYGHRIPLIVGCLSTFVATLGFAFSPWYWMLAVTRVVQAVGSSLSVVAGLALLTSVFTNESERNRANSLAYDGLTLGLLLGMPFGSTLYNFSGRQTPFLILAFLVLLDFLLRILYVDENTPPPPHANRSAKECLRETKSIYCSLLSNPDVVCALLCSLIINGALGALMSSSPAFVLDKFGAEQWQIGVILVCGAAAQLSSQTFSGFVLANYVRPWILSMVGFFLYGIALIAYTHSPTLWLVILPECIGRIGLGLFTCIITPLLARIVDICYQDVANYGAIFGLYVASYNLGLALGPLLSAALMDAWGASVTYYVVGAIVFFAGFLNLRFRTPLKPRYGLANSSTNPYDDDGLDERRKLLSKSCPRPDYTHEVEIRGRSFSARTSSITHQPNITSNRLLI